MPSEPRFDGATFAEWMVELEYSPAARADNIDPTIEAALRELRPTASLFAWLIDHAETAPDLLRIGVFANEAREDLHGLIEIAMRRSLETGPGDQCGWSLAEWRETLASLEGIAPERKLLLEQRSYQI